jgi:F0F1-type ATP synthase assembly protein I
MLIIILIGVFGGVELDKWLKLSVPVFTIVLSLLAVTLAIYTVTKDLLKSTKSNGKKDPDKNE